jgi:ArsR family transcriptional regulator, arsenate/arsenite/antimonite-responsive transcriptional repressor
MSVYRTEVRVREIAQFLKVLADESRLQLLWLLLNHRELCVCDMTEALGISQSKASRHLATLRHAGLVADRREGAWSYYAICSTEDPLERVVLAALRTHLSRHSDANRALRELRARMERKDRDGACAPGSAPQAKSNRKPTVRRPAGHAGANR